MGNLNFDIKVLENLISLGFCFGKNYGPNGKFSVLKNAVFENPSVLESVLCDSFQEAIQIALDFIETPSELIWSAILRYNQGLGIEYKNLPDMNAVSLEEAEKKFRIEAEKILKNPKAVILQIKIRPKQ